MKIGRLNLDFGRTLIMGVLNVTPDSFSDAGLFFDIDKAVAHAKKMAQDGADIIDIGAESTRPGSNPVTEEEEIRRLKPVIKALTKELNIPLSVDTYKPKVANECLELGAQIINDITGLRDRAMIDAISAHKASAVIMHMKGSPKSMQDAPAYKDVIFDIKRFLSERIKEAKQSGISPIFIDPGIGFGKTTSHNLQILKNLAQFKDLGCPILIGPSRKSFIGNVTGLSVGERLEGTLAAICIGAMNGASIVRVHDVKECKMALQVVDAIRMS